MTESDETSSEASFGTAYSSFTEGAAPPSYEEEDPFAVLEQTFQHTFTLDEKSIPRTEHPSVLENPSPPAYTIPTDAQLQRESDVLVASCFGQEEDEPPEEVPHATAPPCEEVVTEEEEQCEEILSESVIESMLVEVHAKKEEGNTAFREGDHARALAHYEEAIRCCPKQSPLLLSILHNNQAAVYMKQQHPGRCIQACTKALSLDARNVKAYLRRAWAYEERSKSSSWDLDQKKKTEEEEGESGASALEAALKDYQMVLTLDPQHQLALRQVKALPARIEARKEEEKQEVMGKLKDFGNTLLGKFGLSTDNFQFTPQEGGGYSMNFKQ